jgi:hypothetical protein
MRDEDVVGLLDRLGSRIPVGPMKEFEKSTTSVSRGGVASQLSVLL